MTAATTHIGWEELVNKCFSPKTLANAQAGKFTNGTHIVQLSWDKEGPPLNQQIIWLLYHPKSMKPIHSLLDELKALAEATDGMMVIIDDYDPEIHWAHTVLMLCDGAGSVNGVSLTMNEDGSEGHMGWIVGQGREIDADDDAVVGALHMIITNIFKEQKGLRKDPFLASGRKKLDALKAACEQTGVRYSEDTVQELRRKS